MTEINDLSKKHSQLYHYTDMRGALGILKSQSLWATHLKFLNDASEGQISREMLIKIVSKNIVEEVTKRIGDGSIKVNMDMINERGGLKFNADLEAEILVDGLNKVMGGNYYVTSFCGNANASPYALENGLLSQWRGYGADGGVALIFNAEKLEEALKKESEIYQYSVLGIGDIKYNHENDDDEELEEEFAQYVQDLTGFAMENFKNIVFGDEMDTSEEVGQKAYNAVSHCYSRYKHHSFCEEGEVRIYTHLSDSEQFEASTESASKKEKPVDFRGPEECKIPYIELFTSEDIILPIDKIIVGPHKDKEKRAASLSVLLKDTDIEITVSETPYIG